MPADRTVKTGAGGEASSDARPLTASCNCCRERKVRCGGEKPSCVNCVKQKRVCEYRAKLKPGLKAGAGNVDNRIKDVQAAVALHSAQLAALANFLAPSGFALPVDAQPAQSSDRGASASVDTWGGSSSVRQMKEETPASPSVMGSDIDGGSAVDQTSYPSAGPSSSSVGLSFAGGRQMNAASSASMRDHGSSIPSAPLHLPAPANQTFTSPQTAAETLLGLSGTAAAFLAKSSEHTITGAGAAIGISHADGAGRHEDVQMNGPADLGNLLIKQLGRSNSSSTNSASRYPPMQHSFDSYLPSATGGSVGLGSNGPSYTGSGFPVSNFSPASFRQTGSQLPPPDVISELVTLYYRHIHPWSPLVVEADDVSMQSTFDTHSPSQPSSSTRSSSSPSVLIHAIVFATLRFSDHPHFSLHPTTSKSHYAAGAKNAVLMAAMGQMSIANLQALTILALGWVHEESGPQKWGGALSLLTGAVAHGRLGEEDRMAEEAWATRHPQQKEKVGSRLYHATSQTPLFKAATSWQEVEERRRLFWQIFCLDTYASVSTGFALSFSQDDVRRRLPSRDGAWAAGAEQSLNPFVTEPLPSDDAGKAALPTYAYFCSIIHILGEVHAFIRAPLLLSSTAETSAWKERYKLLSAKLLAWFWALPEAIRRVEEAGWSAAEGEGGMKVLVVGAYLATTVRLHSAIAYPPVSSPSFLPSDSAATTCVDASVRMAKLASLIGLHDITRPGAPPGPIDAKDLNPVFTWFVWIAARGLIAHAFIKRTPLLVAPTILFLELLNGLGTFWSTSRRYAKIIAAALNESHAQEPYPAFKYDDSATSPPEPLGFARKDSTSSVLADMRRTAFQALATLKEEDSSEDDDPDAAPNESSHAHPPSSEQQQQQHHATFDDPPRLSWQATLLYPSSEVGGIGKSPAAQQHLQASMGNGEGGATGEQYAFDLPQLDDPWYQHYLFEEHDMPTFSVQPSPVNSTIPLP